MSTAIHCRYRPGGAEDRLLIRDVHLEYMMARAQLVSAGGAILEEGRVVGMYLLLATDDVACVDEFLAQEPYGQARLFASVQRIQVQQFMPEPYSGFLDQLLVESRRVAKELAGVFNAP